MGKNTTHFLEAEKQSEGEREKTGCALYSLKEAIPKVYLPPGFPFSKLPSSPEHNRLTTKLAFKHWGSFKA